MTGDTGARPIMRKFAAVSARRLFVNGCDNGNCSFFSRIMCKPLPASHLEGKDGRILHCSANQEHDDVQCILCKIDSAATCGRAFKKETTLEE